MPSTAVCAPLLSEHAASKGATTTATATTATADVRERCIEAPPDEPRMLRLVDPCHGLIGPLREHSPAPAVEPDRPVLDRVDDQVRSAPRIRRHPRAHCRLRLGLDCKHTPLLVVERPAEDDETGVDQFVHEQGVLIPARLLLHPPRRIPLRTGTTQHDEVSHPPILRRLKRRSTKPRC